MNKALRKPLLKGSVLITIAVASVFIAIFGIITGLGPFADLNYDVANVLAKLSGVFSLIFSTALNIFFCMVVLRRNKKAFDVLAVIGIFMNLLMFILNTLNYPFADQGLFMGYENTGTILQLFATLGIITTAFTYVCLFLSFFAKAKGIDICRFIVIAIYLVVSIFSIIIVWAPDALGEFTLRFTFYSVLIYIVLAVLVLCFNGILSDNSDVEEIAETAEEAPKATEEPTEDKPAEEEDVAKKEPAEEKEEPKEEVKEEPAEEKDKNTEPKAETENSDEDNEAFSNKNSEEKSE